jgi:hypothetical protein
LSTVQAAIRMKGLMRRASEATEIRLSGTRVGSFAGLLLQTLSGFGRYSPRLPGLL